MCKVFELAKQLNTTIKELELEYDAIDKGVADVDKEILDIYHFIEFNDLDVVRGYKIYKELQTTLRKRRDLKDAQAITSELRNTDLSIINASLDLSLETFENRGYRPRARQDLFYSEIDKNNKSCNVIILAIDPLTKEPTVYESIEDAVKSFEDKGCSFLCKEDIVAGIETALNDETQTFSGKIWKRATRGGAERLFMEYEESRKSKGSDSAVVENEDDLVEGKGILYATNVLTGATIQFNNVDGAACYLASYDGVKVTYDEAKTGIIKAITGDNDKYTIFTWKVKKIKLGQEISKVPVPISCLTDAKILNSPIKLTHINNRAELIFANVAEVYKFLESKTSVSKTTLRKRVIKAIRTGKQSYDYKWESLAGRD